MTMFKLALIPASFCWLKIRRKSFARFLIQALVFCWTVTALGADEPCGRDGEVISDTSFSMLLGEPEVVSDGRVLTYRLDKLNSGRQGTFFGLLEHMRDGIGYEESYMSLLGRLSFSYLSCRDFSFGPIKDVSLAYNLQRGASPGYDFTNHLYGFGVDLGLYGLDYAEANFFYAENSGGHNDRRFEMVFGRVFEPGNQVIIFDGVVTWSSEELGPDARSVQCRGSSECRRAANRAAAEDDMAESIRFNPQLRVDAGRWVGLDPKTLEVGVEYSWWKNKYGIQSTPEFNTNESAVSLLLKVYL